MQDGVEGTGRRRTAVSRRQRALYSVPIPCMSSATVLIVDDEDLIRWSLRERLKSDGYQIREAADGKAALQQFQEGVDLVPLHYRLPDTDALSSLRDITPPNPAL